MDRRMAFVYDWSGCVLSANRNSDGLYDERAGGRRIGKHAQKARVSLAALVQHHHHFALLIRAGQSALDEFAGGAFQQDRARRVAWLVEAHNDVELARNPRRMDGNT